MYVIKINRALRETNRPVKVAGKSSFQAILILLRGYDVINCQNSPCYYLISQRKLFFYESNFGEGLLYVLERRSGDNVRKKRRKRGGKTNFEKQFSNTNCFDQ